MKTLQSSELDKIRQELINQKVEYIEIIEELTDHIATGIEKQWNETDSVVSFEEALYCEVNKFGDKGLKRVQSKMTQAKTLEYSKKLFVAMKGCFMSSKIVVIVAIFLCYYLLLTSVQGYSLLSILVKFLFPIFICQMYLVIESVKSTHKYFYANSIKKSIYETSYSNLASVLSIVLLLILLSYDFYSFGTYTVLDITVNLTYLVRSIISTIIVVMSYCIHYHVNPHVESDKKLTLTNIAN
jgi:hypothetical protein